MLDTFKRVFSRALRLGQEGERTCQCGAARPSLFHFVRLHSLRPCGFSERRSVGRRPCRANGCRPRFGEVGHRRDIVDIHILCVEDLAYFHSDTRPRIRTCNSIRIRTFPLWRSPGLASGSGHACHLLRLLGVLLGRTS